MQSYVRPVLLACLIAVPFASTAFAQPVEYVKVCTLNGAGYFYVPGTDVCLDPMTGKTYQNTANGPVSGESPMAMSIDQSLTDAHQALEGVAIATAMPTAIIEPGKTFAVAVDFGAFDAYQAVGFGAAIRLTNNFQLNAAVGAGFSGHTGAARVGANFSW